MSYDMLKLAVEGLSSKNTVVLDDRGMPSIMVRVPKFRISDVIPGATQDTHPMFVIDGVEKNQILISKYQNIVRDGRAYSLPLQDPRTSVNFDQAKAFCEAKGQGFHLVTNAERAGIALWSKANGTEPRGNNNYGADASAAHERGIASMGLDSSGRVQRVATGSGPASWSHDGTGEGIYDLNGNVWEWTGGMRLVDGEIQIIVNNNAASHIDQSAGSSLWKAIKEDGSIVAPGTAGTLKYDGTSATKLSTTVSSSSTGSAEFKGLAIDSGLTVPQLAKALGFAPVDANGGGDRLYVNADGERLPLSGGSWRYGANAGVFALSLLNPRSHSLTNFGFRSAYVE